MAFDVSMRCYAHHARIEALYSCFRVSHASALRRGGEFVFNINASNCPIDNHENDTVRPMLGFYKSATVGNRLHGDELVMRRTCGRSHRQSGANISDAEI